MKPLTTEDELDACQAEMGRILDKGESGRSDADNERLDELIILIRDYEDVHWPLPPPRS